MESARFVHLSDVHFKQLTGGDTWDEDADLRRELEADLERFFRASSSAVGILITGDVAFAGQVDQYSQAAAWIDRVVGIVGCEARNVWVVPGNHDVDWSVVDGSATIVDFHERVRGCPSGDIDGVIWKYLVDDKTGGDLYLSPLANYVSFATRYECALSAARPYWEDSFAIGRSPVRVRLRGMTSALVSDRHDDSDGRRLVMGSVQTNLPREKRTVTVTMSHHPISWLRDGDRVDDALRNKAQVQLWGHRHTHLTRVMDGNVHLFAGAVHPQRREVDWEPRYNIFDLEVDEDPSVAQLVLHARVWRRQDQAFGPDFDRSGHDSQTFPLSVEGWTDGETTAQPSPSEPEIVMTPSGPQRDARRSLAYAFSSLPYQRRLEVARELDLIEDDARLILDQELFELVLSRAVRDDRLGDLWVAVQRQHGTTEPNPFEVSNSDAE